MILVRILWVAAILCQFSSLLGPGFHSICFGLQIRMSTSEIIDLCSDDEMGESGMENCRREAEPGFESAPSDSVCPTPICKQFWKAGDYEVGKGKGHHAANQCKIFYYILLYLFILFSLHYFVLNFLHHTTFFNCAPCFNGIPPGQSSFHNIPIANLLVSLRCLHLTVIGYLKLLTGL